MDVLDAGVFAAKWEAEVPRMQTVLWGPLQAKEMGFDGWEWQDGGETGFVAHRPHVKMPAGFATATLIVQNRTRRAYLTVYLGGYPADVPAAQRRLDQERLVGQAQTFLTRLAKQPVTLEFQGEVSLVDNVNDAVLDGGTALPEGGGHDAVPEAATGEAARGQDGAPGREAHSQAQGGREAPRGQATKEPPSRPRREAEVWDV